MEGRGASKTQVYVLRLRLESDGSVRCVLRSGAGKELHFASLEALSEYLRGLEASFRPRGIR